MINLINDTYLISEDINTYLYICRSSQTLNYSFHSQKNVILIFFEKPSRLGFD
jgi:hypothetical protein